MKFSYSSAISYVDSFIPDPSKKYPGVVGLERMKEFLKHLGDPQNSYPVILVGGTSGKGSTATMIASILSQTLKVGLHIKPHLTSVLERIQINGEEISENEFVQLVEFVKLAIAHVEKSQFGAPTYFEILVAMMYLYFKKKKVDVAVVEVGLGGRLDGTNVVTPIISVITSIGFDHIQVLGNTLQKIAAEKFGIIKPHTKVVSGISQPDLISDLKNKCEETKVSLSLLNQDFSFEIKSMAEVGSVFDYYEKKTDPDLVGMTLKYKNIILPVLGRHQVENAALAIEVIQQLNNSTIKQFSNQIQRNDIKRGLKTVKIPGRMEIISHNPLIILDGAHNEDKARSTAHTIKDVFSKKKVTSVVAIKQGKEAQDILKEVSRVSDTIILTQFPIHFDLGDELSIDPFELKKQLVELKFKGKIRLEKELSSAIRLAQDTVSKDGMILITGSMYLVGNVKSLWRHFQKSQIY